MKATDEVAALEKKLDGEIKRLGEKNIAELIDSGPELEEEAFLEDDFDDFSDNPEETFEQYECNYDDEPRMISPMLDLNLGKIEIFRDGNLMGLDIKLRPSINDDTLNAYRTVARDSFEYFGEFCGSGWHRFVLRRFADKPIAFQLQYLGWMAMEIQAAATQVLESGEYWFGGDSFVRVKTTSIN